jgi:hypothetical protein
MGSQELIDLCDGITSSNPSEYLDRLCQELSTRRSYQDLPAVDWFEVLQTALCATTEPTILKKCIQAMKTILKSRLILHEWNPCIFKGLVLIFPDFIRSHNRA